MRLSHLQRDKESSLSERIDESESTFIYDETHGLTADSYNEGFSVRTALIFPFFLLILYVDLCVFIPTSSVLGELDSLMDFNDFKSRFIRRWKIKMARVFYSEDANFRPLLSFSAVAGSIFGGIHCLAWQYSFPSPGEQFVWRAASLGVTGACAFALIALLVTDPFRLGGRLLNDRIPLSLQVLLRILFFINGLILIPIPFVYPFARIALLVIAFTSLRSLPPSAYQTIGWIQLIPHV